MRCPIAFLLQNIAKWDLKIDSVTTRTLEYEDKLKKAFDFSSTFSIEGKLPQFPVDPFSSTSVSSCIE
jgi:hypothetical protein